jgi:hypothetical protein
MAGATGGLTSRRSEIATVIDVGRSAGPVLLLCQGRARFQRGEDDAGEQSFEAADRFTSALTFGAFAFEVGAFGLVSRVSGSSRSDARWFQDRDGSGSQMEAPHIGQRPGALALLAP